MQYLAQLNIARMKEVNIDNSVMAGFVAQLDEVDAIAEASPDFVWRLKDEDDNNTTGFSPFSGRVGQRDSTTLPAKGY